MDVGTLLLGNDKNNVTADKLFLSYFKCLKAPSLKYVCTEAPLHND